MIQRYDQSQEKKMMLVETSLNGVEMKIEMILTIILVKFKQMEISILRIFNPIRLHTIVLPLGVFRI